MNEIVIREDGKQATISRPRSDWNVNEWSLVKEIDELSESMRPPSSMDRYLILNAVRFDRPERGKADASDVLLRKRLADAVQMLKRVLEIDPQKSSGIPVLKGTRFKAAQVLGEIADGSSVAKLCREYNLDREMVIEFLRGIAIHLDRPFKS